MNTAVLSLFMKRSPGLVGVFIIPQVTEYLERFSSKFLSATTDGRSEAWGGGGA